MKLGVVACRADFKPILLLVIIMMSCSITSYATDSESLYSVTRNVLESSLHSLSPFQTQDCMVESYCATLCTSLNKTCASAIFAAVSETCHLFTDSQLSSLIISPNSTQLSYFEKKPSCYWTATAGFEHCCYAGNLTCMDHPDFHIYQDCQEAFDNGERDSGGIFFLKPDPDWRIIKAVCQFDSTSGWIVIQRRLDGSVDFYRDWDDYANGFGNLSGEYWIGLDAIHYLTMTNQQLSIILEDHDGGTRSANYSSFYIDGVDQNYVNHISGYSGDAGDSWGASHNLNGMAFTTRDNDNDNRGGGNCAVDYSGAWWYNGCHHSNLNGLWFEGGAQSGFANGINWNTWRGLNYALKAVHMRLSR